MSRYDEVIDRIYKIARKLQRDGSSTAPFAQVGHILNPRPRPAKKYNLTKDDVSTLLHMPDRSQCKGCRHEGQICSYVTKGKCKNKE